MKFGFGGTCCHIENDASNNSSIVACIHYCGNASTELLPSNNRGIFTEPLPSKDKGFFLPNRCLATIGGYTYRHKLMGGIF
jgi:hypothetical protein